MTISNIEKMSDEKLRDLKQSLEDSSQECTTKAGLFWGQGFQAGSDLYNQNAEEFGKMAQEIGKEIQKRNNMTPQERAKKQEEMLAATGPANSEVNNNPHAELTGTGEIAVNPNKVPVNEGSTAETKPANQQMTSGKHSDSASKP